MQILVRVSSAFRASGHIVKIINPLDVKRHVASAFDEGEVATRFGNFGQVNESAVFDAQGISLMEVSLVFSKRRPQAQAVLAPSWKSNFSPQRQTQPVNRAGLPRTNACPAHPV